MATWKKVIVSGSAAELSSLYVQNSVTASIVSASQFTGSLFGSSSYALTASYALNATSMQNLTFGTGLSGSVAGNQYNGSQAVTVAVSGSQNLQSDRLIKWTGTAFASSSVSENGNTISLTNLSVSGDLTVAGTASFTNAQNLLITDQFIALGSGSNSLIDGGFVVINGTSGGNMSGSAFYLESTSTGPYGRFAVQGAFNPSASAASPDEYVVTNKISTTSPTAAPTWGGATNGVGNMWIDTTTNNGEIWIYA